VKGEDCEKEGGPDESSLWARTLGETREKGRQSRGQFLRKKSHRSERRGQRGPLNQLGCSTCDRLEGRRIRRERLCETSRGRSQDASSSQPDLAQCENLPGKGMKDNLID